MELDLSTVVPSIAGPKRPQDRIVLSEAKAQFGKDLLNYADIKQDIVDLTISESFPASDPGELSPEDARSHHEHLHRSTAPATASNPAKVSLGGSEFLLDHGAVTIASITSCTNTSNPSVMLAAGLLARNASKKGLEGQALGEDHPGSRLEGASDYYDKAGLTPYLEDLGFFLVGYGCMTCIGNSGPLPEEISAAVQANDLAVTAVLSGNRNFEDRVPTPDIKMNYLASPPLVIAYALAGSMNFDFETDTLGTDTEGNDVYLRDIWPDAAEVQSTIDTSINTGMFTTQYASVFEGDERWKSLDTPTGATFEWDPRSTYVRKPPYFDGMTMETTPVTDIVGARVLAKLGDSVTTDHISPAGSIKVDSPAGKYLTATASPARTSTPTVHGAAIIKVTISRNLREHPAEESAAQRRRGWVHPRFQPGRRTAGVHLRRRPELPGSGHSARHSRGQGVRFRFQSRLGGQGHVSARRARSHHRELRTHPPLQPDRHGSHTAAVPGGAVGGFAGPRRH